MRPYATFTLTFLILSALALLGPTASGLAQQTQLLVCRGGELILNFNSALVRNGVVIRFTRGREGAARGTLQPGTCAWIDRPVSENEPSLICHRIDAQIDIAWAAQSERIVGLGTTNRAASYIFSLRDPGNLAYFHVVHNRRTGCLDVARLGP